MELRKVLSASSFAHLLGLPKAARAEDDDPKKQREGESDDDYAKRMDDDKKKDEEAASKKAEEEKKEKEKAEEQDGDEEMKGDSAAAQARNRERARCAAIFASPAAGKRPDIAAHLAFSTTMPRADAISLLETTVAGEPARPRGLASRMEDVKVPNPGSGGAEAPSANDPRAVAAAIVSAGKKRRGEAA